MQYVHCTGLKLYSAISMFYANKLEYVVHGKPQERCRSRAGAVEAAACSLAQPVNPDLLPGGLAIQLTVEAALAFWEGGRGWMEPSRDDAGGLKQRQAAGQRRPRSMPPPGLPRPQHPAQQEHSAAAAGRARRGGAPCGSCIGGRRACS